MPTGSLLMSPHVHRIVASFFGSGLILGRLRRDHAGSGTVGAAFALPLALVIGEAWGVAGQVVAIVAVLGSAAWAMPPLVATEGDAGWIVVDEVAGMFVAVLGMGFTPAALVAFLVFRAADIFKNWFPGVAAVERVGGSLGVMADDLVAGLYGLVAGQIALALL